MLLAAEPLHFSYPRLPRCLPTDIVLQLDGRVTIVMLHDEKEG